VREGERASGCEEAGVREEDTMKHRHSMRKLGRTSSHRWALLRNLVSQLVQHERLETTVPKVSFSPVLLVVF
jgi:hypothetical protein